MANSRIGAEQLTVAKVLLDPAGGTTTYDVPYSFTKKLIKLGVKNKSSMDPQYADDQTVDIFAEDGDIDLDIENTDITEDEKALLLGQTVIAGVRTPSPSDVKPFFCVAWKSKKRDGTYKYFKILKVMFSEPDEDFESKKDKTTAQTDKIKGVGIGRFSDGLRKRTADASSSTWLAATGTNWFTTIETVVDSVAPTVGIVPANGATGIATSATVVWTFNKAIMPSCVIPANFMLTKVGVNVAGTLTINAANTIVTFTPTSALSAGVHTAIATTGVKSASNIPLAAPSVTTFTV